MNQGFFKNNREKYLAQIGQGAISILNSGHTQYKTADQEFEFVVNSNFFYLTGIDQDQVTLFLAKVNGITKEMLFIDENDESLVKWVGRKLTKEEASDISGIDVGHIFYNSDLQTQMINAFQMSRKSFGVFDVCYLDLEFRNLKYFTTFGLETAKWIKDTFPSVVVKNAYPVLIALRAVKEDWEIDQIKQSIQTTKEGLDAIFSTAKPGIFEYELKAQFDFVLSKSNKKHSFDLIAAGGGNATTLHYVKNNQKLHDGDLILFDLGCYTNHYASDISRTIPVSRKFSSRQREIYEIVLDVNKRCIEYVKEGITWADINQYAKELLAKSCIRIGLIQTESEIGKYYYHSVSHSLGIDVHDPAVYTDKIPVGAVITIEPGLYIEEEGIGIRIEDNVLVTKTGGVNLSEAIVKEIDDVEKAMKR